MQDVDRVAQQPGAQPGGPAQVALVAHLEAVGAHAERLEVGDEARPSTAAGTRPRSGTRRGRARSRPRRAGARRRPGPSPFTSHSTRIGRGVALAGRPSVRARGRAACGKRPSVVADRRDLVGVEPLAPAVGLLLGAPLGPVRRAVASDSVRNCSPRRPTPARARRRARGTAAACRRRGPRAGRAPTRGARPAASRSAEVSTPNRNAWSARCGASGGRRLDAPVVAARTPRSAPRSRAGCARSRARSSSRAR